jgi:SAM-dependent methyltransferase
MKDQIIKGLTCVMCGDACKAVLKGLFDNRYGSPGAYDIFKCGRCSLEQTWPRPPEAELKLLYEEFYNWGGQEDSLYYKIRERFLNSGLYRLWLKWDGDLAFHLRLGRGRLLDVGCNEGRGLALYARNGFEVEGLEINERAAAAAQSRGFAVHTVPLAEFFPEEPYGVVVLANVLEHAVDPAEMLTQVRRLLRPGGEVWISCPNAGSRWRRLFGRHWINWHVPYHLWHFTPETLGRLLSRTRLRLLEMETFTPSLWLAQSLLSQIGSHAGRANQLMRSPAVLAGLMMAGRTIILPLSEGTDRQGEGDCLVIRAST